MTNSLVRRTATHLDGVPGTFTARYSVHRLVYFEYFQYVLSAIRREKELKHWTREQRIELIERVNPTWEDLYPNLVELAGEMPSLNAVLEGTAKTREADSLRE